MSALIILTIVCALTYTFEIVFGLAGTILMLPLLSFLYDAKTLVIYSVLPQILVAVIGLVRSPKKVDRRFMAGMLFFAGLGAIVGFALFYYFSASVFQVLLASAITAAGLFLVIAPHRAKFNPAGMRVMDTLAGTSSSGSPAYAATYPGPPSTTLVFPALSSNAGTHSSRSRPVVTKRSACARSGTKLGFGCTKCGFSAPVAMDATVPRSPTISRAMTA